MSPHCMSSANPGLQALVLCGPGSSFLTFTTNPDENPKALLPIANRPMVWYSLEYCYRMGVTDITLICPPSAVEVITTALNTNPHLTSLPSPKPTILAPEGLDYNTGTAKILAFPQVRSIVTTDFFVLPCDIVCEVPGHKLIHAWTVKGKSMITTLGVGDVVSGAHALQPGGLSVWYNTNTANRIEGEEADFAAWMPLPDTPKKPQTGSLLPHLSSLVYAMPLDTLNDSMEDSTGALLRPRITPSRSRFIMSSTFRDAHIYLFPHWAIEFVHRNEHFESIGEDVLGWWAKAGWQAGLAESLHISEILRGKSHMASAASDAGRSSPAEQAISLQDRPLDQSTASEDPAEFCPRILAYVHPDPTPNTERAEAIIRRVDTGRLLLNISLQLAKLSSIEEVGERDASPLAHARKIAHPEGVAGRTTITKADSLIAEHVIVEEKSSIKESVVGANCKIGEGVKLLRCVLMDAVVVGKSCRLTGCILGKRSIIGERSVLTDCEVQENLIIDAGTEQKGENLMSSQGLEDFGGEI